jgi:Golgi nucleoside diphosphatase
MIDAGSTGSRIHVYKVEPPIPEESLSQIQDVFSKKIDIPLSGFAHYPSEAGSSLAPLISAVQEVIPSSFWPSTPIYLQATAGLRALDPTIASQILDSCGITLISSPFAFNREMASVISGHDEGVNAWVAVNYLQKSFLKPSGSSIFDFLFEGLRCAYFLLYFSCIH